MSDSSYIHFEEGLNNFTFSLYRAVEKNGNDFLSPFSIVSALLLLMLGTDGTTKNQMMKSIFNDIMITDVDIGYRMLHEELLTRAQDGVSLSIANRLFCRNTTSILQTFTSSALEHYGSEVEKLDFASQADQSRIRINSWVAMNTKNKILDALPQGSIGTETIMFLANAVYLKGIWQTQFDPRKTRKQNFYVGPNNQKQVNMMHSQHEAESGENLELDCKVLKLPYKGENLSMIFVLPNAGDGLLQLESQLTRTTFDNILYSVIFQETIIDIPKFTFHANYKLNPTFIALGMTEIFDQTVADFSRIVSAPSKIYVSDARHNAFIDVDEQGSEAVGGTTITTWESGQPFEFRADHPFLFFILDNVSGTVLFMGRYAFPL